MDSTSSAPPHPLRLLTWNLWFDEYMQIERLLAVLSYIEPLNPHVLALQEVTLVTQHALATPNFPFSQAYREVPGSIPPRQWYWESIYSRLPIGPLSTRIAFAKTDMGRGLTVLHVPEYDLVVGCTHLESENEHKLRRQQLQQSIQIIEEFDAKNMFLLGDLNTRGFQHIDDLFPEGWQDAGTVLNPKDPGYTVDYQKNKMIITAKQHRLDRICYKSKQWEPKSIRLIGKHVLKTENDEQFLPSDHFGLFLECDLKEE